MNKVFISTEQLAPYGNTDSLSDKLKALLEQQKKTWELLRKNYDALEDVQIRNFDFGNFQIKIQFNPGRIVSSTAKVDKASIKARKCFLCLENLPENQRGILFDNDYLILANPYPIFNEHFTIPSLKHQPQDLTVSLDVFLKLSEAIGEHYVVFYNGPKAGASAPDHLHFQAGSKHFLPIYDEIVRSNKNLNGFFKNDALEISYPQNYLRNLIKVESSDSEKLKLLTVSVLEILRGFTESKEEPMINVLAFFENGKWVLVIIPRKKHRPDYYFKQGEEQILFSPASVDLGGVCITPRKEDFEKMNKEILTDSLLQVTFSESEFSKFLSLLSDKLTRNEIGF